MKTKTFFDNNTGTLSHIIIDLETRKAAIIDPVLDYDADAKMTSTTQADKLIAFLADENCELEWLLETHTHADHLSASGYIKSKLGGKIGISSGILQVLAYWVPKLGLSAEQYLNARQFDVLFADNENFSIGEIACKVWHTPGHTPCGCSYLMGNSVFIGDTLFAPEIGSARCDFPGASATTLYQSVQRFYALPERYELYLAHDYPENGAEPQHVVRVVKQKQHNIMLNRETSLEEFIEKREQRDQSLSAPKLMQVALNANLQGSLFKA